VIALYPVSLTCQVYFRRNVEITGELVLFLLILIAAIYENKYFYIHAYAGMVFTHT
jgi:hypothetical protein